MSETNRIEYKSALTNLQTLLLAKMEKIEYEAFITMDSQ